MAVATDNYMLPALAFLPSNKVHDQGLGGIQHNKAQGGNQTKDVNIVTLAASGRLAEQRERAGHGSGFTVDNKGNSQHMSLFR
jgi:hypothetical protein